MPEEEEDIDKEENEVKKPSPKKTIQYLTIQIKMQREISNKVFLGNTVSLYDDAGRHLP